MYYAPKIAASASNTVTVAFNAIVPSPEVRIMEYRGIDPASPVDAIQTNNTGTAWISTSNANDLIIAGSLIATGTVPSAPAAAYTQRLASSSGDMVQDRIVSTADTYDVQATSSPGAGQIIQAAAFRLAGGGETNTQQLTVPTNLAATASGSQISLTWTGSTDNMGVTGYIVERCAGTGCGSFEQIAKVPNTSYADPGPFCSTCGYTYRVRAVDTASLRSGYSNVASAIAAAAK
jgi:hypothetical protein